MRLVSEPIFMTAWLLLFMPGVPRGGSSDERIGRLLDSSALNQPVIPLRAIRSSNPRNAPNPVSTQLPVASLSSGCPPVLELGLSGECAGIHSDDQLAITEIYVGDAPNNRIIRHTVDANLNHTWDPLSVAYGVVWLAEDLDLDGDIELVVQRGDGGNGYLDVLSAPDWSLRERFVMPGMKVEMNPVAVNMDADSYLELYVTPLTLGGTGRAQLIKYNHLTGGFDRIADIPVPAYTGGPPAVGDFDSDGRIEFISGHFTPTGLGEYGLFEYDGLSLNYVGPVGVPYDANTQYAAAARPKPGGVLHALLGYSGLSYRYQLLEPTGDNTFNLVAEFTDSTGWSGAPPCAAMDINCDGLDEMIVHFYPTPDPALKWNETLGTSDTVCRWPHGSFGTFVRFHSTDLNQDGIRELSTVNTDNLLRAFQGACAVCTSSPPGMLAWWGLDESFADTAHDSWSNHDGQQVGAPLFVSGKIGGGLRFDSPGEGVRVVGAAELNLGTGDFSIDAWINTTSSAIRNPILSKYDPAITRGWALWVEQGNRLALRLGDGTTSDFLSATGTIANGAWHHVAVTVIRADVAGVKLYLDGAMIGSGDPTSRPGDLSNTSDLWLGHADYVTGDSSHFDGALDEVRLFSRALTATEIRSIVAMDSLGNCKPKTFFCDCRREGDVVPDSVSDVFDIIEMIDYAFSGGTQPPRDSNCPHVDRGDVNCDGIDDVFDVMGLIDYTFSGGTPPCNPCTCSPYPTNCP